VSALVCAIAALGCIAPFDGLTGRSVDREESIEREREATADIARQLRATAPFVNDPILLAYINEIGQALVSQTEPQPFIYRFSIIDDDRLNAFTIGGGHVYLHSAVIAQAGNVSELAGVLAHEIAHVRERHIARRPEGQTLASLATLAATLAVAAAGADPQLILIAQSLNVALALKNSRSAEAEADFEGIQYLIGAGYAPLGLVRFFERILVEQPRGGSDIPAYLFTHPAVKDRIGAAEGQIARMDLPGGLRIDDPRLARMQERLARLEARVAGGSGLQARAAFDRTLTDPALERANTLRGEGQLAAADALLAEAADREPSDPRVPLLRAELAEALGDLDAALVHLERAFALDPYTPVVPLMLGQLHGRRGERARAVFFLEQAAAGARRGSALQARAEREIDLVTFPPFEVAEIRDGARPITSARRGTKLVGYVKLGRRARRLGLPLRARVIAPRGQVEDLPEQSTQSGEVTFALPLVDAEPGEWVLELRMGDSTQQRVPLRLTE
jgi:predicted Zn-dependent protease